MEEWIKNTGVQPVADGVLVDTLWSSESHAEPSYGDKANYWEWSLGMGITHWRLANSVEQPVEVAEQPVRNKYMREIKPGVWVDVYDVIRAFVVTDGALQHLLKKALAVGQRGHKDATEDYKDILASAKRALEIHEEWSK